LSILCTLAFFLLQFLLQLSQCTEIAQGGFLHLALYVLNGLPGVVGFRTGFLLHCFFLVYPCLFPDPGMRYYDTFFIPIEFNHHELRRFVSHDRLSVFPVEMAVGSEAFQTIGKLYDGSLVVSANHCSLMDSTRSKSILEGIPGILFQLFMT